MKRTKGLSWVIILLILSNIAGLVKVFYSTESLSHVYTVINEVNIKWFALVPRVTIIGLIAMWIEKLWGFLLVTLMFCFVLGLDLYSGVWVHALAVTVSYGLLFAFWIKTLKRSM